MENKQATQIAAKEVDINMLYGLYLLQMQKEDISQDDFFVFVQTPSSERDTFLNTYCNYEFKEVGETTVIKLKVK